MAKQVIPAKKGIQLGNEALPRLCSIGTIVYHPHEALLANMA